MKQPDLGIRPEIDNQSQFITQDIIIKQLVIKEMRISLTKKIRCD